MAKQSLVAVVVVVLVLISVSAVMSAPAETLCAGGYSPGACIASAECAPEWYLVCRKDGTWSDYCVTCGAIDAPGLR